MGLLQSLVKGTTKPEDIETLRNALIDGHITLSTGKGSVAIGGDVRNSIIVTGSNVTFDISANALRMLRVPMQFPSRAPFFSGREELIKQILDELLPTQIITLVGPGGIGKTAVASEAIWRLKETTIFPNRFPDGLLSFSFYNQPNVGFALEHFSRTYGEEPKPTALEGAKRALSERKVLLLLDGTEVIDNLEELLKVCGSCGVLITSRNRNDNYGHLIEVKHLPHSDSIPLLKSWSGASYVEENVANQICDLIGYLPLAVRIAGRYMQASGMPPREYLSWLSETSLNALDQGKRQSQSINVLLEKSLQHVSESANLALGITGLLALSPFTSDVIESSLDIDSLFARRILGELVKYSLINIDGDDYQTSHKLIHEYAQMKIFLSEAVIQRFVRHFDNRVMSYSENGLRGYTEFTPDKPHILFLLLNRKGSESQEVFGGMQNYIKKYFTYLSYSSFKWLSELIKNKDLVGKRIDLIPDHIRGLLKIIMRFRHEIESIVWLKSQGYSFYFTPDFSEIFNLVFPLTESSAKNDSSLTDWYADKAIFESDEKIVLLPPYMLEFRTFIQSIRTNAFKDLVTDNNIKSRLMETPAKEVLDDLARSIRGEQPTGSINILQRSEDYKDELGIFFDLLTKKGILLLKETFGSKFGQKFVTLGDVSSPIDFRNEHTEFYELYCSELMRLRRSSNVASTKLDATALSIVRTTNTRAIGMPNQYPFLILISRSKTMLQVANEDLSFDLPHIGLLHTFWKPETYLAYHLVKELCDNDFSEIGKTLNCIAEITERFENDA